MFACWSPLGFLSKQYIKAWHRVRMPGLNVLQAGDARWIDSGSPLPAAGDSVLFASYDGVGADRALPVVKLAGTST